MRWTQRLFFLFFALTLLVCMLHLMLWVISSEERGGEEEDEEEEEEEEKERIHNSLTICFLKMLFLPPSLIVRPTSTVKAATGLIIHTNQFIALSRQKSKYSFRTSDCTSGERRDINEYSSELLSATASVSSQSVLSLSLSGHWFDPRPGIKQREEEEEDVRRKEATFSVPAWEWVSESVSSH